MKDESVSLAAGAWAIVFIAAMLAGLAIYNGWIFVTLWGWFAVPLGAPKINIAWAVGLAMLVHSVKPSPVLNEEPKAAKVFTHALVGPAVCLLIGYIAKGWM
jgi:hypothetical protein